MDKRCTGIDVKCVSVARLPTVMSKLPAFSYSACVRTISCFSYQTIDCYASCAWFVTMVLVPGCVVMKWCSDDDGDEWWCHGITVAFSFCIIFESNLISYESEFDYNKINYLTHTTLVPWYNWYICNHSVTKQGRSQLKRPKAVQEKVVLLYDSTFLGSTKKTFLSNLSRGRRSELSTKYMFTCHRIRQSGCEDCLTERITGSSKRDALL